MHACRKHLFFVLLVSAVATAGCDMDSSDMTGQSQAKFLVATPGADLVPDSYIVVLHQDPAQRGASPAALAERTMLASGLRADRVTRSFGHALTGFVANISRAEAEALLADPSVKYIEQDQYVSINETWGLDRTDQRFLPLDNANFAGAGDYAGGGAGVHAYIIDTGVRLTHNEFSGRIGDGYDAVDNDNDPSDCNGHGTHVAGTVAGTTYGLAKSATVHGVRVLDCGGSGTYAGVIAGIDWVTANHQGPAVANMSLGGGYSQAVNDAVTASVQAGVVYAVAAGNDYGGDACTRSPSGTPDALTVGSTTSTDARSSFSNIGPCVDLFAPGSSITSAWHTGDTATNTISGTSMATPHVAGAVALYRANNPAADAYAVSQAVVDWATEGRIADVGAGSPNKLLYAGDQVDSPPPPPPPACSDPASCEDVTLTILLDNYPSETSWNITRAGNIVASGGGYSGAGSTVNVTVALDAADYIFTIFDSYGDGICCAYGSGWYELRNSSGAVLAAGGAFTTQESTPFTISGGGPPPSETVCDDGIDNDGDGDTDCADSDCAGDPVCGPPPACFPVGDSCSVNSDCCSNKCGGPPHNRTCKN
jgi:subtilisin family serine protease